MWRMRVVVSCAAVFAASLPALAYDGWHQESAVVLQGGASGFDYISYDAVGNHVFLGHRKEGLQVFDAGAHKLLKVIGNTSAHSSNGALLLPDHDLGISNNEDGTITPFVLSTLEAKEPIKIADGIDTSHFDPTSKRIVVNTTPGKDGTSLIVLDVPSLAVVGTVKVNTVKAEHAEGDGKGNFYLASRDPAKLYRIDVANLKVTAEWDTPGCAQTNSLAYDKANNRLFLGCRGSETVKPSLAVVDAATGAVIYTTEIGANNDGVIFDPEIKRIFAANGNSGNINIIEQVDANTYRMLETLNTRVSVKTIAYDHKNKRLFGMGAETSFDAQAKKVVIVPNSFTVYSYVRN